MSVAVKVWISIMLVALMGLTGVTIWRISRDSRARPVARVVPPQDREQLPPKKPIDLSSFEMIERSGERIRFDALEGQVWIASMFFSSCPFECRQLNETMAALHRDPLLADLRFVSISVDPAIDTPQALSDYAKLFGADARRWLFMHGDINEVGRFGEDIGVPAGYKTHTQRIVLIDGEGRVQGYYRFNDAADIEALKAKAAELLDAGKTRAAGSQPS